MTIFTIKSLLSIALLLAAVFAMTSMYELFGRQPAVERIASLKRRHRTAGYVYGVLFLFITYLCVDFATAARTEPSPRAGLHILVALSIVALFLVKMLFLRVYRKFYEQAKTVGTVIGVLTFMLVGISAGYFLAVTHFGRDHTMDRSAAYELRGPFLAAVFVGRTGRQAIRTDRESIERGRALFSSRCAACHDPNSDRTIMGPGLQGLLKKAKLPASGHPATAESIRFQLRQPLGRMPSFAYLSDDEMDNLIAYLNTL